MNDEPQHRQDGYLEKLCERAENKCLACGGELIDIRSPQDVWNAWQRGDIDVRAKVIIMEK